MRSRRLLPLALLSGLISLAACFGEDAVPSTPASSDDGGPGSTPDSSSTGDAGSADGGSKDGSDPSSCIIKTSGPHAPGTVGSVGGIGPWEMPANAKLADGAFAITLLSSTSGTLRSDWIEAKNFGFEIPAAATIRGIEVQVLRGPGTGSGTGTVKDSDLSIGDVTGKLSSAKIDPENWPRTSATASYGGGTDSWGLSLMPRDVASSNFGVRLSVLLVGSEPMTAEIDAILIDVTYCE